MSETCCPKCNEPLVIDLVVEATKEQRFTYTVHPMPGMRMTAQLIGGQLKALGDLMDATGKHLGQRTVTMVDRISMHENGSIEFNLFIAAAPKKQKRKPSPNSHGDER